MARNAPLTVRRYVARGVSRRPMRSALTSAGVAVAVAFFVLFGSMSSGLHGYVAGELARPRPTHVYLARQTLTPYRSLDEELVSSIVAQFMELGGRGVEGRDWSVAPRVGLPLSNPGGGTPVRLWGGLPAGPGGGLAAPPLEGTAVLAWGRHLAPADDATGNATNGTTVPCVLGSEARRLLFPGAGEGAQVELAPDASVDPWRLPSAAAYPVEPNATFVSEARGPVRATVVGLLAPGQGSDVDDAVFVPVHPLLRLLGQYDAQYASYFYPELVVSIADGGRADIAGLEVQIASGLPYTGGTDDGWDRTAFERNYGGAMRTLDAWLVIITSVMALMLAAGVSDTMLVSVADRRSEIATLRAVGVTRRRVAGLVLGEVLLLSGIGLLAGLLAGGGLVVALGQLHSSTGGAGIFFAPVRLSPWIVLAAVGLGVGTATLAGLYPARRAAREPPTEALRYE